MNAESDNNNGAVLANPSPGGFASQAVATDAHLIGPAEATRLAAANGAPGIAGAFEHTVQVLGGKTHSCSFAINLKTQQTEPALAC